MKKFWVSLPENYYEQLLIQSKNANASIGAMAAELIIGSLSKESVPHSLLSIQESLLTALNQIPDNQSFYIRDLVPDSIWNHLTRSEKMTYAKTLARLIRNDEAYTVVNVQNKINYYARTNAERTKQ